MKQIIRTSNFKMFEDENFLLIEEDSFRLLREFKEQSIDMVFADPPYFLSNGGVSCSNGKMVSVNKGKWDEYLEPKDKLEYNREWIKECRRILTDNGTIWISGTLHNIYSIGMALELEGFDIINNITWEKPNPPPNLGCRSFTHSTETIIWARKKFKKNKKGKHVFNYKEMKLINDNKQMKDVWIFTSAPKKEKTEGKHPTQKPLSLIDRIITSSTNVGDIILDPFSGTGTTGISSFKLGRRYIGIEIDSEFNEIGIRRFRKAKEEMNNEKF